MNRVASVLLILVSAMCFSVYSYAEATWIDVRSSLEHSFDNINGDPRISHGDIVEQVAIQYPDKNTEIRLYCMSGGRSGKAVQALKSAGYTRVFNAGGIDDARKARGISN